MIHWISLFVACRLSIIDGIATLRIVLSSVMISSETHSTASVHQRRAWTSSEMSGSSLLAVGAAIAPHSAWPTSEAGRISIVNGGVRGRVGESRPAALQRPTLFIAGAARSVATDDRRA